MTFENLFPILLPITFVAGLILERIVPARSQAPVPHWLLKGVVFFVLSAALNAVIPAVVISVLGGRTLFHLRGLGAFGGAALMLLLSDFAGYGIHRGLHTSERVWRWTHQLHHSAERMDMAGAAFFHPFDAILQQVLPGMIIVLVLGITPLAAAVGGFAGFLLGVTPHLNIRTPRWLGYVFQRPEMHAIHHQRGVHAYNYGVLALSDQLFGTWRNPKAFPEGDFGFWDGSTATVAKMLRGMDVTRPPARP
jgi:sterol desaturase/sphingolipid hydroxylase (fatty acid hydroxylase superfamily)